MKQILSNTSVEDFELLLKIALQAFITTNELDGTLASDIKRPYSHIAIASAERGKAGDTSGIHKH